MTRPDFPALLRALEASDRPEVQLSRETLIELVKEKTKPRPPMNVIEFVVIITTAAPIFLVFCALVGVVEGVADGWRLIAEDWQRMRHAGRGPEGEQG